MPMQAVAAYGAAERAIQTSAATAENKDEEDLMTVVASITQAQLYTPMGNSFDKDRPLQGDGAPLAGSTRIRRSRRQAVATAEPSNGGAGDLVEDTLAPVSVGSRTRRSGAGTPAGGTRLFTQTDQEQTDAGAVDREAAREKGMDPVGLALQRRLAGRRTRI
jgi:hypothetical protein